MLKIHFLNVGKGSCTIIDFPALPSNRLSIIDIDTPSDSSLQNPIAYLDQHFPGRYIFRFILTHPDMDHMNGLKRLAEKRTIYNFWDTDNDRPKPEDFEKGRFDENDWDKYQELRVGTQTTRCLKIYRGRINHFWNEDHIRILSPTPELVKSGNEAKNDYHDLSYVLMVEHQGVKVLFGGEASSKAWGDILDKLEEEALKADIFVVPHHGSEENIHDKSFRAINATDIIVCGEKNVTEVHKYYKDYFSRYLVTTKDYGNIAVEVPPKEPQFEGQKYKILVERLENAG
ncbi:hypothetical protein KAX21_01335 [candidate division WOR-3 bacterium]|nr:hypothetical protein [candidate division WOR-3 bacterium]